MKCRTFSFLLLLLLNFSGMAQCLLTEASILTGECNVDGSYDIELITESENVNVDIFLNSQFLGYYELDSMGLSLFSIQGNGITKDTFVICENDIDTCCVELIINNPCLCGFANITADIFDCDETANTFFVELDFEPQNNGSGFVIGGNGGTYGSYDYGDQAVTLGPFNADNTQWEFIFFDNDNALCFDFIDVGVVDCAEINACVVSNVNVEALDCQNDGSFFIELTFDIVNPGQQGFTVQGNGTNYGSFDYGQASYQIGPLIGDCITTYEFVVIDIEQGDCLSAFDVLEEPICCEVCEIWDLTLVQGCEPWFGYIINFNYSNPVSDQFDLFIDQMFLGTYNYSDLPIMDQLGFPVFQDNLVTIQVSDSEYSDCSAIEDNVEIGCDQFNCYISELFVEAHSCEQSFFMIDFEFESQNTSNTFDLYVNGIYYQTFEHGQQFYTAGPFEGGCNVGYEFQIIDSEFSSCQTNIYELGPMICCEDECLFDGISVVVNECDSDSIDLDLYFAHIGNSNASINIYSREGLFGVYDLSSFPISLMGFPNTGEMYEFIQVCLTEEPDCCEGLEWLIDDCSEDCLIDNISVNELECDEEEMSFVLNFNHQGTTNEFFDVFSRDGFFGFFSFSDLPLNITGFPNTGFDYEFIRVCENDDPDCCAEFEWLLEDCETGIECQLSEITIDPIECDSISMSFVLNFEHDGTTNEFFDVYSRVGLFETYLFTDLPLTLVGFPNTGQDYEFIRVCENDNQDCCVEHEWLLEDCISESECELSDIDIETLECDSTSMSFVLNFNHQGTSNQFFDVYSRNGFFDFYSFGDLPITITDFPNTGFDYEFIRICENDNPDCCTEHEWLLDDCSLMINTQEIDKNIFDFTLVDKRVQTNLLMDKIELFSIHGKCISSRIKSQEISLDNVPNGIYIIRMNKDGNSKSFKIYR